MARGRRISQRSWDLMVEVILITFAGVLTGLILTVFHI